MILHDATGRVAIRIVSADEERQIAPWAQGLIGGEAA
jgi:hypothetical protein